MPCQACGANHEGRPDACPVCGGTLESNGCIDRPASGTAERPLVTDGGQPADDDRADGAADDGSAGQSTGGQSTGGQSTSGQSTGGQSTGGQPTGGQAAGGQSTGGQATDGGQARTGGRGTAAGADFDVNDLVDGLPLRGGATIGAIAMLLPYLLLTVASYVPLQRDEFGISAELYATIVGFGPGERFVDLFVGGTHITSLGNVDPDDYPSVEAELDAVIDTLQSQPEALLLPLYVMAPLVCYLGGRHLAKKYAGGDSPLEYGRVALALPLGALPIALVVSLVFGVEAVAGAVLVGGLIVPLLFGALGGLTVYAFRDFSWTPSKAYGWLAGIVGVLVAVVLIPIPTTGFGVIEIDLAERTLFGLMGFLGSVNFGVGGGAQGTLMFLLILLATVGAGFLRAHRSERPTPTAAAGAHLGASIALGLVAMVAAVAIALPFLSLVISLPFGATSWFAAVLPSVSKYTSIVFTAAIYALAFGAAGGALSVWHRDRENTQLR